MVEEVLLAVISRRLTGEVLRDLGRDRSTESKSKSKSTKEEKKVLKTKLEYTREKWI